MTAETNHLNKMKFSLLLLAFAALLSCKSRKEMPNPNNDSPLLEFEQHGCRGYCPTYKLSFLNNGVLRYEGLRNVEQLGVVKTAITPEELTQLRTELADVNLWQYPEVIESKVADAQSSTMTVYRDNKSHSVMGSIDRPKPILELETKLKNLAESHGLRVKKGIDPNAPAATDKELIVKLKDNVNAGNWLMQFESMKLHLVRRLSAENMWLVSYDPAVIEETKLINLLKTSEGVLDVQVNKATKDRN